jgi:hypothetical protein
MEVRRSSTFLLGALTVGLTSAMPFEAHARELSVGMRGGLDAGYVLFEQDPGLNREVRPGLLAGGVFAVDLRPGVALQAEILYAQKGWGQDEGERGLALTYLEVPLLLRLQGSGRLLPHLLIGSSLSHEVGCHFYDVSGTGDVDCDHPLVSMKRSSLDVSFVGGGGIGRAIGAGTLSLDALLHLGMRDIIRDSMPWGTQSNIALSLSLTYAAPLGGERRAGR